jgi:hypothetical protein
MSLLCTEAEIEARAKEKALALYDLALRRLHYLIAPVRWVKPCVYARHYGISPKTVQRGYKVFKSKNAMRGKGKAARLDIFFNISTRADEVPPMR